MTRLFGASDIVEFLMQRSFFFDLAWNFTNHNLLFCSALGISPSEFPIIHEHLSQVGSGGVVVAADFQDMDMHATEEDLLCCLLFWFGLRGYDKSPDKRVVDSMFPALAHADFVRFRLVRRLAHFIFVYRKYAIAPGQMHPSGSFLTTIINITLQILTWSKAYSLVLGVPVEQFYSEARMVFLGDDSLIALPAKWGGVDLQRVTSAMETMGFIITSDVKTEPLRVKKLWDEGLSDYSFLSRRFATTALGPEAPLDPVRCRKIVCFVAKNKEIENMPQQFSAFVEELMRYRGVNDREHQGLLLEGTVLVRKVFGCSLEDFMTMDSLDMVERYGVYVRAQCAYRAEGGGDAEDTESLGGNVDAPTTFVEDVVDDTVVAQDDACEGWRDAATEDVNHEEGKIFNRPFNFANYAWNGLSFGIVHSSFHPSGYFQGNFNAQVKLANYVYLRGVMCFRAVMTSTPYTSGKLCMSVRPAMGPPQSVVGATGDPCVELDAASGKTACIKVPCVMPAAWAAIEYFTNTPSGTYNSFFDWCNLNLSVITTLRDPSAPVVNVKLYAWLEDVELKSPGVTSFALAPQGGPKGKEELKKAPKNKISTTSGPVPSEFGLMSIVKGAHAAVKTIGGVLVDSAVMVKNAATLAALVGLSDPSMLNNTTLVASIPHFDAPHMYGTSPAVTMAASQACKVVLPYGAFSLTSDCMDIARYSSRMAMLGTFPWVVADTDGTQLLAMPINAGLLSAFNGVPGYTPLSFAATHFRFWRGSLRYRFALAKTRFHAGVIEIVWQMGLNTTALTDDAHATICYRAVWDIQESESFEVVVPYCSMLPWTPTWYGVFRDPYVVGNTRMTGIIRVRVVNPLLSSNGFASDSIDVVVYTAAGPDIEFAVPSLPSSTFITIPEALRAKSNVVRRAQKLKMEAEGGGNPGVFQVDETDGLETTTPPFIMANIKPMSEFATISCIGERIMNFRLLLRRFSQYADDNTALKRVRINDTINTIAITNRHPFMSSLACTFAFYTGGYRVAVLSFVIAHANIDYLDNRLLGVPEVFLPSNTSLERVFTVPWHHVVPFQYIRNYSDTSASPLSLVLRTYSGASGTFHTSVAAADDFSYAWQIGPELANLYPGAILFDDDCSAIAPRYW